MVRILHFSDFHYRSKNDQDYKTVVNDLVDNIKDERVDFAVFSGDLIQEEKDSNVYTQACNTLIVPVLDALGLDNKHFLITPGNHDKKLDAEMKSISKSLEEITTVDALEDFIKDTRQKEASMDNFKGYSQFICDFYNEPECNPFFHISKVDYCGKKAALISINSSWRSFNSLKDRGQLIFPISILNEAFSDIDDCQMVICSMHHNLSDFQDAFESEISDVIERKCTLLLTGHYHKFALSGIANSDIGIIHSIAPASYNRSDHTSMYGYSIIEINEEDYEVNVIPYIYSTGEFVAKKTQTLRIPMSDEKKKIVDFNKTVRQRVSEGLAKANDLFITGHSLEEGFDFMSMFTEPVIKDKSFQEIITSKRGNTGQKHSVNEIIDDINDIILYGGNKCGKTSLLWKIYLEILKTGCNKKVVPYILECRDIREGAPIALKRKLQDFLQLNKRDCESLFEEYSLLLLIDDIDPNKEALMRLISDELKNFPNHRIIATSEETISGQLHSNFSLITDSSKTERLYFHALTSSEVHQLTLKWPNMPDARKKKVETAIRKVFLQMHIPFNYWTASLFLWLYEKTDENKIRNNFELVRLYVDELLGARDLISSRKLSIDYNDLLSYLAALAKHILLNEYAIDYLGWTQFTEQYKAQKKKFTEDTRTIQDLLLEKGIIVQVNEKYTFRLKGLFEYFIAYRMSEDDEFKDNILADDNYYLSFGNEIELYAGFCRSDLDTAEKVLKKTQAIFSPLTSKDGYNDVDSRLSTKAQEIKFDIFNPNELLEQIEKKGQDEDDTFPANESIIISSKVQKKRYYDTIETNANNLEKAIFILSRVFRNSDVCDNEKLSSQILNFILTGTCNLGFVYSDEILDAAASKNESVRNALSFITGYIPVIMQSVLYDSISQANLARVFEDKLKELSENIEGNQYRYFLIAFILIDTDMNKYKYLLDDIRGKITMPILKFMCYNKCILLMLKDPDNKELNQPYRELALDFNTEYDDRKKCDQYIERTLTAKANQNKIEKIGFSKDYTQK